MPVRYPKIPKVTAIRNKATAARSYLVLPVRRYLILYTNEVSINNNMANQQGTWKKRLRTVSCNKATLGISTSKP